MRDCMLVHEKILTGIEHLSKYTEEIDGYVARKMSTILNEEDEKALDGKIEMLDKLFLKLSEEVRCEIQKAQAKEFTDWSEVQNREVAHLNKIQLCRENEDLAKVFDKYNTVQRMRQQREEEMARERYLIANPNATEKELLELTNSSHGEEMLSSAFALGSYSARASLEEAKDRMKKITSITAKIKIISRLLKEIDTVVKKNGKVVDNIVINMDTAQENTTEANNQLRSAYAYAQRVMSFKRMFALIGLICIICIIIYFFRDVIFNRK